MSQVVNNFVVCDYCKGEIPKDAPFIGGVNGTLTAANGVTEGFSSLDFCCTAHAKAWLDAAPNVATPSPLYSPPA